MKQEIEIKLSVGPEAVEKLIQTPFFVQLEQDNVTDEVIREQKTLSNVYYDTSSWQLHARKIALRIRTDGGHYIQTLKAGGVGVKGLHKRLEWEWPLIVNRLDTQLLPSEHWPSEIAFEDLQALFCTEFSRRIWLFSYFDNTGVKSKIEMALDQGSVSSAMTSKRLPICELELELISGSTSALQQVAKILIEQCPQLTPCDISKAARGYQLLE